ncbi:MAG: hypothetical protein C4293_01555 [Nitrospiraceae bacterium]
MIHANLAKQCGQRRTEMNQTKVAIPSSNPEAVIAMNRPPLVPSEKTAAVIQARVPAKPAIAT